MTRQKKKSCRATKGKPGENPPLDPKEEARLRKVGERLLERRKKADAEDREAILEAWDLGTGRKKAKKGKDK